MRRAASVTGVGAAVGLVLALAASRLLRAMLFQVSPTDPVALGGACLILLAVGAFALETIAHAAQIVFSSRGHHASKVIREIERTRIAESHIKRAKQLALDEQLIDASRARFQVLLELRQRHAGQLAVDISRDVFHLTSVVDEVFHVLCHALSIPR